LRILILESLILIAMLTTYLLIGDNTILLAIYLALLGSTLSIWFITRESILYKTWTTFFSSTISIALAFLPWIPTEIRLLITLLILLGLLTPVERYGEVDRRGLIIAIALSTGFIGAILGLELLPWIILSPLIEIILIEKIDRNPIAILNSLYIISIYGLSMRFSYIVIIFMLLLYLARLFTPFLRSLDSIWLDTLIRFVFVVVSPWI